MMFELARVKDPVEKFRIGIDFVDDLEASDAISTQVVTAIDLETNADVTATLIESPAITGTIIQARVKAGTAGSDYVVRFQATTAAGDILRHGIQVHVR